MASSAQASVGASASAEGPDTRQTEGEKESPKPKSNDTATTQETGTASNQASTKSIHDAARDGDIDNLVFCLGSVATSSGAEIINSKDKHYVSVSTCPVYTPQKGVW